MFSLVQSKKARATYVALIDIGSGSVTGSIAESVPGKGLTILWSKQERILLKKLQSNGPGRHIMTALMNIMLELGQAGLQTLREHNPRAHISDTQVSIAAPWSYTITKTANYDKADDFHLSHDLIENLLDTLEKTVQEELLEHEVSDHLGLSVVSRVVTGITAEGYVVTKPAQQTAKTLALTLSSTVVQDYLQEMILDTHNKVFPKTKLTTHSFILMLFFVLRDIHPEMREYCIVNQTLEATELGIVRDGVLQYSTHEPYGLVSLSRDLSDKFGTSLEEVYGYMQSGIFWDQFNNQTSANRVEITKILDQYENMIHELLQQTGDAFTIPKTIYTHTTSCTHSFIAKHIEKGAQSATGMGHIVHDIHEHLLQRDESLHGKGKDRYCTALVAAYFFHTCRNNPQFIER